MFNQITNLSKTKKLTLALSAIIFVSAILLAIGKAHGGNFQFLQTDWTGGADTNAVANHSNNQTGWSKFFSKDSQIDTTNQEAKITTTQNTFTETSDTDFNAGTKTNTAVASNSVKLLKPNGATCSAAGDCQSSICTGNLCVAAFTCGTSTVTYGTLTYNTVQIGTQCWFRQNLNVGTRIAGTAMPDNTAPTLNNPATVSKWCYGDTEANCTTDGGLYSWAEANALANSCNTTTCTPSVPNQGICPTGWHIPTHDEYTTLERSVCTSGTCVTDFPFDTATTGWRGTNEGSKLSTLTLNGNNSSGFTGLLAGYREVGGGFYNRGGNAYLWSASAASATVAWDRYLSSGHVTVFRDFDPKTYGFSVRCVQN